MAWSEVECHCRCPLTAALMLRPFVLCAMGAGTVQYCHSDRRRDGGGSWVEERVEMSLVGDPGNMALVL